MKPIFLLASLLAIPAAQATTLQYLGLDTNRSLAVWMQATYAAGSSLPEGGHTQGSLTRNELVEMGVMRISIDGLQAVDAFCIDFFAYLNQGLYHVDAAGAASVEGALRAGWLVRNVLNEANGTYTAAQVAAAVQLAIWDVVNDGGDGLAAGRIQLSTTPGQLTDPGVAALAAQYLAASAGKGADATVYTSVNGPQDMQRLITSVPEPGTWSLAAAGAAALLARAIRRRKAALR